MSENKSESDDFDADPSNHTVITDSESDRKVVTSMFHIVPQDIVLTLTFTIYLNQGKACLIFEEQP